MYFQNFNIGVRAIYENSYIIFSNITTKNIKLNETIYNITH
jgi:hypothetical protein